MAARRRARTRVSTGPGNDIVVVNAPAPVARRSGGTIRRRRRRRSSSAGGGSSGASYKNKLIQTGIGGFGYGVIEKFVGDKIPEIPILGKSGTIALGCYFLGRNNAMIRDVGVAAAAIAGYSFGKTGTVSGFSEDDD